MNLCSAHFVTDELVGVAKVYTSFGRTEHGRLNWWRAGVTKLADRKRLVRALCDEAGGTAVRGPPALFSVITRTSS